MTAAPLQAQEKGGAPADNEMAKMMELARPGEKHKLLASLAGTWDGAIKMWMDPDALPMDIVGTLVRRPIMDGRFFIAEATGRLPLPGAAGDFHGMEIDGFDNVKGKFVTTWMDTMGTGILLMEGDYDGAAKTITYRGEMEMMPGVKSKVKESLKMIDADRYAIEWFEVRSGKDVKTMEVRYTRKK